MTDTPLTGYPSIDKPWLKYYSEEAINTPLPERTMYEYVWQNNKAHLDDVAMNYFDRKITYRKLFENIERTANAFAALGVGRGDVVPILLPNIPENVYCIYALNKIGAIADMIDLRSKGEILQHYINQTGAKVAVICDLFAENAYEILGSTGIQKLIVGSPYDSLPFPLRSFMKAKKQTGGLPNAAITWKSFWSKNKDKAIAYLGKSEDAACIFHTSGTTGLPKGVVMTNLCFNAMTLQYQYGNMEFSTLDRFMNQVPPYLAYNTILSIHLPLVLHMTILMLPEYNPSKFAENVLKLKPNHVFAGPADWSNFLNNPKVENCNLSFMKAMASGSDTMRLQDKRAVNELIDRHGGKYPILEGYGMTEIGSAACACWPNCDVPGSVGIPLPLNNFCIYDNETEQELPYGQVGEICMSGPTVMKEYYQDTAETANTLRLHKDGILWLHSGDLGRIDENGCVYLDGRIKRIIIRHDGIKISPFAIEKTILKHPNVSSCCVIGMRDREHNSGQIPVAFIVQANTDENTLEEVKKLCASELSDIYMFRYSYVLESLPLTANGKIDYRALEKQAKEMQTT